MNVKVVGWKSPRMEQMLMNAQAALNDYDRHAEVEWIRDVYAVITYRLRQTPALIINGKVKGEGRIPSVYEIRSWIEQEIVKELRG